MPNMVFRIYLMLFMFLCGFLFVGYRLYNVQIERHDELYAKARERYTKKEKTKGTRGEIYDIAGNLLVCNIPVRNLAADPGETGDAEQCRAIARFLAGELKEDEARIYERLMMKEYESTSVDGTKIMKPCRYVMLARGLELEFSERLKAAIRENKFRGLIIEDAWRRSYPKGEMLANILGITSIEHDTVVPLMGLEKSLDQKMQSGESFVQYERARDGRRISYGNMEGDPVRDGCDIYLTVQEPIQAIMEEEMDKLMERTKSSAAYAIMVDPNTGDIMAVSQRPSYNPNDRTMLRRDPNAVRNRIAEDCFEPGSVMKSFVISMALDRNVVTPDELIDCTAGCWVYARRTLRDTHRVGVVPIGEIIKQSSNIGTAKVALKMGEKRLAQVFDTFGFGQRTGIPLNYEAKGHVRPLKKWDGLSITRFCIGQGISVSMFQLVRAYCMIANGGYPVNLRLVDRLDRNGITEKYPYVKGECVFKRADTARIIRKMLISVTQPGGTGTVAAIPGYHVAGKTGTAEKFIDGQYRKRYFASFCGFVPAENPRFVLLVTCDEPKQGGYFGGTISGPAFKAIAERTLNYLHVPYEMSMEDWNAEFKALKKKDHERRVKEDERVRAVRAARGAQSSRAN